MQPVLVGEQDIDTGCGGAAAAVREPGEAPHLARRGRRVVLPLLPEGEALR